MILCIQVVEPGGELLRQAPRIHEHQRGAVGEHLIQHVPLDHRPYGSARPIPRGAGDRLRIVLRILRRNQNRPSIRRHWQATPFGEPSHGRGHAADMRGRCRRRADASRTAGHIG